MSLVQGGDHTCGIATSGAAYCWGSNYYGQVGQGSIDRTLDPHPVPALVTGGLRFTSLVAGGAHTCGLTISGAAYCWGSNRWGDLGDGTLTDRGAPVAVLGGLTFSTLTVGGGQSCGVTTSGAAFCWGENAAGEGGDGSGVPYHTSPVAVAGGLTFKSVSAGGNFTCGLSVGGTAYCWGLNTVGQLGDGLTDSLSGTGRPMPAPVLGGLAFASLDAGGAHACGVTTGGAAYCWGGDGAGALGDSATNTFRTAPVAVRGGLTFASLTAGAGHTCGVTTGGAAYCWGSDGSGQLGDGLPKEITELTPVAVAGGLTFTAITAGVYHACGVSSAGTAYCWGNDAHGELGDASTNNRDAPVAVAGGLAFTSVAAGNGYTCGLSSSGSAYCWGDNFFGQLGDSSKTDRGSPAAVAGGHAYQSLTVNGNHTCGLTSAGLAYCWGEDGAGQLGDSSNSDQDVPVAVKGGLTFAGLTAGYRHTCGLTSGGVAYCWGANGTGQLGDGTQAGRRAPVAVVGGLTFVSLTAGWDHTCGLARSGVAYCWGNNNQDELGVDPATMPWALAPVGVSGGLTFASLVAGPERSCGLTGSRGAYCWGSNTGGALGDGSQTDRATPVAVKGGLLLGSIATGEYFTCGLTNDGAAFCWGNNSSGQLGNGRGSRQAIPIPIAVANP